MTTFTEEPTWSWADATCTSHAVGSEALCGAPAMKSVCAGFACWVHWNALVEASHRALRASLRTRLAGGADPDDEIARAVDEGWMSLHEAELLLDQYLEPIRLDACSENPDGVDSATDGQ